MKTNLLVLILFFVLAGCNVLNREKKFDNWKNLALDYNTYIKNNCKRSPDKCEADFYFGKKHIKNYIFNKFRKGIIDSCTNIKDGKFLIIEESGSGEVYYYSMYIFDLSSGMKHKRYRYISESKSIQSDVINFNIEQDKITFVNNLDYVKLNDSLNWRDSPIKIGINFVSYTSIKNGKINFVKFIPKPIAAAELQF